MNTVSIIGRANVGKSTLFNRLAEKRQAMVSDIAGTTRDLKYAKLDWQKKQFEIIDTGGFLAEQKTPLKNRTKKQQKKFIQNSTDDIDKQVELQAREAINKSQIIIFVVDTKEGINPQDKQIAAYLRKTKDKKIILAANKCDAPSIRSQVAEFHKLGLGDPIPVSAANGSGTGDLLDIITNYIKKTKSKSEIQEQPIKISLIGKPNAGKSSLLNAILGEDKAIVSSTPHTTREPNDTLITYKDKQIILIDTAGIRRKAKVKSKTLEELGVKMSISTLKKSDATLLVLDSSVNISKQDLQLGQLLVDAGGSVIIAANKYDLIKEKNDTELVKEYTDYIYKNFPHLSWAPIIFTSASTGFNVQKILNLVLEAEKEKNIKIPDGALSKFLKTIIKKQPPPRKKIGDGQKQKIKRAFITELKQIDTRPPTFECKIDTKEKLPENYRKYIINQLRQKFGFKAVPVKLVVKWNK